MTEQIVKISEINYAINPVAQSELQNWNTKLKVVLFNAWIWSIVIKCKM